MDEIKVGTKLWIVFGDWHRSGKDDWGTVTKVGRRWLTLDVKNHGTMRADKHTLRLDGKGFGSPGQGHRSKEAHEDKVMRESAWRDLVRRMSYHAPESLTLDEIQALRVKCGLKKWERGDAL